MIYVKAKSLSGVKAGIVCDQALPVVVVVETVNFQFGAESWAHFFMIGRRGMKFAMTRPMPQHRGVAGGHFGKP